jgi:hypothetical protein
MITSTTSLRSFAGLAGVALDSRVLIFVVFVDVVVKVRFRLLA